MAAQKSKVSRKDTLRRFMAQLLKQKWQLAGIIVSLILSALSTLAGPILLGQAIDIIADQVKASLAQNSHMAFEFHTLIPVMCWMAVVFAAGSLFSYVSQSLLASVSQNVSLDMRKQMSEKLNKLPLRFYDNHKKGDILSRMTSDMEKIADTLQEALSQLFTSVITIVGAFIMMFMLSPVLTWIAIGTIILSIVAAALVATQTHKFYKANQDALGRLNANIEESFTGNSLIKAFNLQQQAMETNQKLSRELMITSTKAQFVTYAINPLIRLVGKIGYVLIAVKGALSVIAGQISIGDIQAVFQYVNQVSEPVTELAYTINTLQGALASAERIYEIMDEPEEVADHETAKLPAKPEGRVAFNNLSFGYTPEKILMKNIDTQVKPGQKIAIVGPTGAGKTTLVNLLMRFYEVNGGSITIDDVDIRDISRKELRSVLGMVLQDTWLFHGTVAENIAYGKPNATREEIIEAAKSARVDHFIRTLPNGYDTILDDELSGVSAGQKQLLTIARAILANPSILILDEATSSVDTRTEEEIQKAMDELMKGRTSFVIAHRLSTIEDADKILVMNNGDIIEDGTHEELLAKNGFYAQLYNSQFAEG